MVKSALFLIFILIVLTSLNENSYSQLANKNMYLLANVNTHSAAGDYSALWGYKAPDGREYAILGCYDGTQFVDITDDSNIHQVGFVPSTNPASSNNIWREMKTYSHYAYIVSEVSSSGIQIVDLQYLPDSVHYVKKFLPTGYSKTHSISQSGPYLYVNGQTASAGQGVTIYDLSINPETPVKRGAYNSLYVHDCRIFNDTIYAANISNGKISIINAVNKNSLSLITSFNNLVNSGPHNTAVTDDRKNLLVTDEIGALPRQLKIWDIQNLSNISFVTGWQPTGITNTIVHNVETYGKYALIAHYEAGVRLVDITNPAAPNEVAWYDTYPNSNNTNYEGCWAVYMFPSGKIIASDISTGLYVLKTSCNIKLAIEGLYDNVLNKHNIKDTVTAYLRNVTSPYAVIDSSREVIDNVTLTGNFKFNKALSGTYYISVRHRNSIETWSKINGEIYNPMTLMSYDFTTSNSKAYGNNMTQVDASPVITAIYSGDVTQDGVIDASDMSNVENDKSNSVTGYVASDLNGDYAVDASDVSIVENNTSISVMVSKP
jgi:choice-of-anchor B domain-containing protein